MTSRYFVCKRFRLDLYSCNITVLLYPTYLILIRHKLANQYHVRREIESDDTTCRWKLFRETPGAGIQETAFGASESVPHEGKGIEGKGGRTQLLLALSYDH